ncbi:MAG TPA: nitroreductase family protein [Bacteroidota bacterium]|nr:nitroreductase family protein [Bacteroidota bacterium]
MISLAHQESNSAVIPVRPTQLHPLIEKRRSTRAFAARPVEDEKLLSILEAARWAPSSNNGQPWRYIVVTKKEPDTHRRLVSLLSEGNRLWAVNAPVLIIAATKIAPSAHERAVKVAFHDLGLANANLSLQAQSLGLAVHQMGGFDVEGTRKAFEIPDDYEPLVVIAVGYEGPVNALPDFLLQRELAPRVRKSLSEIVFKAKWGERYEEIQGDKLEMLNKTINN